jgi:hypothetical protein
MSQKPQLVQFGDLTPRHFERHPVWVQCHIVDYDEPWYDETDEETFRPRLDPLPADPAEGMLLVRAEFTLGDGSQLGGFLTPAVADGSDPEWQLRLVQPQVFMPAGGLAGFWEGAVAAGGRTVRVTL